MRGRKLAVCLILIAALVAPTIAAEPGGGGTAKYVKTAGDAMEGDLDMQGHSLLLSGTPLQGSADGALLYGGLEVCLDGGTACQGPQGPEGPMGPAGPQGPPGPGLEDDSVMANHVADGQIGQNHLSFDTADQAELDALSASVDAHMASLESDLHAGLSALSIELSDVEMALTDEISSQIAGVHGAIGDLLLDLATDDGTPPNTGSNLVHWNNLNGVPADFADGDDAVDGGIAAGLDCAACIDGGTGGQIADESITSDDIATNAIFSDELADNAVDTAAIQIGAVTGEAVPLPGSPVGKIALGTIGSANLADGAVDTSAIQDMAVTSSKIDPSFIVDVMSARAAWSAPSTPTTVAPLTPTVVASATLAGSSADVILLTGQFQATLASSLDPSQPVLFQWQVIRDGAVAVSPPYQAAVIDTGSDTTFGSVSVIDAAGPGAYSLQVEVLTADASVTFSNAILNAANLGWATS